MRDFTLDESTRTEADDSLEQMLTAAHTELVDAIGTKQNAGTTGADASSARPAALPHEGSADSPAGGTTVPSPNTSFLPRLSYYHLGFDYDLEFDEEDESLAPPEVEVMEISMRVSGEFLVGPALEEALATLKRLQNVFEAMTRTRDMAMGIQQLMLELVERTWDIRSLLTERRATRQMVEQYFKLVLRVFKRFGEQIGGLPEELHRLVSESYEAVTYLFDESDNFNEALL